MKGYNHPEGAKEKHDYKVRCPWAEGAFFKHSTVSISEDHVEEKIEANCTKEQESCCQTP